MRKFVGPLFIAILMSQPLWADNSKPAKVLTDAEIRQILIKQSIAQYPGNCPCPYNLMKNGRTCGKVSAYSKPGGYSPLCYPGDVSDEMVKDYRKTHETPREDK